MRANRCASLLAAMALLMASACGLRDDSQPARQYFMPDMIHSEAYDAYMPNPNTRDGKTLQRPTEGTVARGYLPLHFVVSEEDAARAGEELTNPLPLTPENLSRGRELYETFCYVCHGSRGLGDGPLVPKIPTPPAYNTSRIKAFKEGRIFHTITVGYGNMKPYASQIVREDRWRIVHYVQKLQREGGEGQ